MFYRLVCNNNVQVQKTVCCIMLYSCMVDETNDMLKYCTWKIKSHLEQSITSVYINSSIPIVYCILIYFSIRPIYLL